MKLLITLLIITSFEIAIASDGKILFVKGSVWLNKKHAQEGSAISYGDKIKTGKNAMAILSVKPGAKIKIKSNTRLVINKPKTKNKTTLNSYILKAGEIFIKAQRTKKNRYSVRSRSATMRVRGTNFFVSSSKETLWMCVNEGSVEVIIKNIVGKVLVNEGEGVNISKNTLPEVKKYDWTKNLNWKMKGNLKEIEDKTNIQNMKYDLEEMDYD
jgi:hypothetical protein